MAIFMIEFDAVCITCAELAQCLEGGEVLEAIAILNKRWEDYSAADLVKECRFQNVKTEYLQDDSAGTLILTVNYLSLAPELLENRLKECIGIINYQVYNPLFIRCFA